VDEAARLLGRPVADVRRRIKQREIYAVPRDGDWVISEFQFNHGCLIQGVETVVPHLPANAHPIEMYTWFTSPSPDLEGDGDQPLSPREWLLEGRSVEPVVEQALDL
jgi:hypothetical protein